MRNPLADLRHSMLWHLRRMPERAVERGVPPHMLGWRWRAREPLESYVARNAAECTREVVLAPMRADHPLPRNVGTRADLSRDGALWGYAMHDVPDLGIGATAIVTLEDAALLFFATPGKNDFFPALVSRDGTSLESREISHRPGHAAQSPVLAQGQVQHFARATWILERAYHNHSHWLTAHLPKILVLKERGMLGEVLMPLRRTKVMDASLVMLGLDPASFRTFDAALPVAVDELTLVTSDRFDPRHMQAVRAAFAGRATGPATRRIFVSRVKSRGRRITNEAELWAMLARHGFEKVLMEDLAFPEQVAMMQETGILLAPHGAGLTNMVFCPEGSHVVEMADPGFANPNFYNLASGLGLHYWLLHEEAGEADHPLDRDLTVDVAAVAAVLERIG